MKSNRRLLLIADGRIAEDGPSVSGRLLVGAGCEISDADMQRHGLTPADLGLNAVEARTQDSIDLGMSVPQSIAETAGLDQPVASDFKALSTQLVAPEVKASSAETPRAKPKKGK